VSGTQNEEFVWQRARGGGGSVNKEGGLRFSRKSQWRRPDEKEKQRRRKRVNEGTGIGERERLKLKICRGGKKSKKR